MTNPPSPPSLLLGGVNAGSGMVCGLQGMRACQKRERREVGRIKPCMESFQTPTNDFSGVSLAAFAMSKSMQILEGG